MTKVPQIKRLLLLAAIAAVSSAQIVDIPATDSPATGRGKIQANFETLQNRVRSSAACTELTDGKIGDLCNDTATTQSFVCVPTEAACDTSSEWYELNGGNAQGEADMWTDTYMFRRAHVTEALTSHVGDLHTYKHTIASNMANGKRMVGNYSQSEFYSESSSGTSQSLTGTAMYAHLYGGGTLGGRFRGSTSYAYQRGGVTTSTIGADNGATLYGGSTTDAVGTKGHCYVWAPYDGVNTVVANCYSFYAYRANLYQYGGDQTATVTNRFGYYNDGAASLTGDSTLQNNYGFYTTESTGAVNNWNLFSAGATSKNFFEGLVQIGRLELLTGAEGTCDADSAGKMQRVEGGTGVADTVRICVKDAADSYGWTTVI